MPASPDPAVTLHTADPVDLVRRLKAEEGRDIWLCGGGALAGALIGEIDELILKVNPIVIGSGIPLFEGVATLRRAEPIEHTTYPNGFTLSWSRLL
jgi:dihydrofolate reductase